MRILKKIIRKLYHLIWFLSIFIIFVTPVKALEGELINPSQNKWLVSTDALCTNSYGTSITTNYVNNFLYVDGIMFNPYYQCNGFSSGNLLAFNLGQKLSVNQLYSLTIYVGNSNNAYLSNGSTTLGSGNWNEQAINSLINNSPVRPTLYNYTDSYNIWTYFSQPVSDTITTVRTGSVYIIFKSNTEYPYISTKLYYNSSPGNLYFFGYNIEPLGDATNLTSSDIQSIINNSGLASASSVNDVQRSVNQVQQDINRTSASIIDNQNDNTNKEIDSQKVCKNIDNSYIKTTGFLDSSGSILSDYPSYGVTSYINVSSGSLKVNSNYNGGRLAFYTANKTFISAINNSSLSPNSYITIPSNAKYVRFTINKSSNSPSFTLCTSGNQALNDSVNDLNDSITDSNIDSSNDTLNSLKQDLPTNSVISDLMLLPVRLLQAIVNSLGGTCSSFNLGSLYGTNLVMPCIDIESVVGSTIWIFIDLVFSGVFILVIRKKFIEIFHNITNLRGGSNEVD